MVAMKYKRKEKERFLIQNGAPRSLQ